jgi:hypothetical protein
LKAGRLKRQAAMTRGRRASRQAGKKVLAGVVVVGGDGSWAVAMVVVVMNVVGVREWWCRWWMTSMMSGVGGWWC